MMDELASAPFWLAIGKIAWVDVLLSGDNAIVIALAARNLPPARQRQAVLIGSQGEESIRSEEVAGRLGTINYEVTCGISARVPREPA